MSIIDYMNARPNELNPGDVLTCVVTAHVTYEHDGQGHPYVRLYRCPNPTIETPQGDRVIVNENAIIKSLFPVLAWAGMKSDSAEVSAADVKAAALALPDPEARELMEALSTHLEDIGP